jgi:hypothetical protein
LTFLRSSRDDVHVATRVFPGVAIAQPRQVDARGGDMAAFANLFVFNRRGKLRDVTLDISVELFSKVESPIPPLDETPLSSGSTSLK